MSSDDMIRTSKSTPLALPARTTVDAEWRRDRHFAAASALRSGRLSGIFAASPPHSSSVRVKLSTQVSANYDRGGQLKRALVGKLSSLARRAIANTLLLVTSVLFGYVTMEYAMFRV